MFTLFAVFPRPVIRRRWIWIAALVPAAVVTAVVGWYMMLVVYRPERLFDVYLPAWSRDRRVGKPSGLRHSRLSMLAWNYRRLTDVNEQRRVRVLMVGLTAACVGLLFLIAPIVITNLGLGSGVLASLAGPTLVIAGLLIAVLPCSFAYAIVAQRLFEHWSHHPAGPSGTRWHGARFSC